MKIIGKQKDYYDHLIRQYGVDEKIVLDRRGIGEYKTAHKNLAVGSYSGINVSRYLLHCDCPIRSGLTVKDNSFYLYERDAEIDDWLIVNGRGYPLVQIGSYPSEFVLANKHNSNTNKLQMFWTDRIYKTGSLSLELVELSKQVNRTAFIGRVNRSNQWEIAGDVPNLGVLKFASIMNARDIYLQTIDFISEHFVAKGEEAKPQTDIEKVVSHGFDKKISFRGK